MISIALIESEANKRVTDRRHEPLGDPPPQLSMCAILCDSWFYNHPACLQRREANAHV